VHLGAQRVRRHDPGAAGAQVRRHHVVDGRHPGTPKQIDFTNRLFLSPTSVIVRKSAGFGDTVESLKGKQVGVLQGSLQEAYARAVLARWARRSRPTSPRTRTTPT
jgi:hypothetical protein